MPVKNVSIMSLNDQHTYLAVFKPKGGSLRIFQMGLPYWKPPITVYASQKSKKNPNQPQSNINAVEDPVIHLFWNSRGNSLSIIHRSGKVYTFFIETKTLHHTYIDYFASKCEQRQEKTQNANLNSNSQIENGETAAETVSDVNNLNSATTNYCFVYDNYGERLFVSNGESACFISLLQNKDTFLFTSGTIFDIRRKINIYNSYALYPIKSVFHDVRQNIILITTSNGIQFLDANNGKFISDFFPVVSEMNPKHRCILDAHFVGNNQISVIIGSSDKYSDDKFELNFSKERSDDIECDCDNSFYSQFDNCYFYGDVDDEIEKENKKEFKFKRMEDGDIKSLIIFLTYNINTEGSKYEIKPDLLIKSSIVPLYFDYYENRGILSDEKNIVWVTSLKKLEEPKRCQRYYSTKSNQIIAMYLISLSDDIQIKGIAMSTINTARILLSNGFILDESLQQFGEDMLVTSNKTPIQFDNLLSTKNPPVVYYIYESKTIEGLTYKYAFYTAMPIFSCLDHFLRYLEIPFAFDGLKFYILPDTTKFGSFNFKFVNIGQHILIDSMHDYYHTIYLINFVYRKYNILSNVICEALKEVLNQGTLSEFLMYLIPHLKIEEISQIITELSKSVDNQFFSPIFDAIFNYISYSNKYYTDSNKKYMVIEVNYESFSSKIIKFEWNNIFSTIDKNIRNQIFLNISTNTFPKLVDEINSETINHSNTDESSSNDKLIFNEELIRFLLENGEIIRAYLTSTKENSNLFCQIFQNVACTKETFSDALNIIENEKNKWCNNEKLYPLAFHLLGCLFQVQNLSLFSAATFIIIGQIQKFNAVLISDESIKKKIDDYLAQNTDAIYAKEIREALETISK